MTIVRHRRSGVSALRQNFRFRVALALCLSATLPTICRAASMPIAASPTNPVLSVDQMKDDLRTIRDALREGDPGLYRFSARSDVEHQFEQATNRSDHAMTSLAFYRIIAPAVASFGDGHLQLQLSAALAQDLESKPVPPLIVRVLNGKAFVWRDLSGGAISLSGFRIDSVDGHPASEIVDRIEQSLSLDGSSPTGREHDAGRGFGRALLQLFDIGSPYNIVLSRGQKRERVVLAGVAQSTLTARWRARFSQDQSTTTGLSFPGDNTALITIAHWDTGDNGSVDLSKSFKEWFGAIQARHIQTLIIDIRNNGGGEETLGTELLSYLVDRPFSYYRCAVLNGTSFRFLKYALQDGTPYAELLPKYARPSTPDCAPLGPYSLTNRPNLGEQAPRSPHYTGAVYLLLDGEAFPPARNSPPIFAPTQKPC